MLRKWRSAKRGELPEPSVVELPSASLIFGFPNAALGLVFYAGALGAAAFFDRRGVRSCLVVVSAFAFAVSLYLAYELVGSRRSCPYCWAGHVANATILLLAAS